MKNKEKFYFDEDFSNQLLKRIDVLENQENHYYLNVYSLDKEVYLINLLLHWRFQILQDKLIDTKFKRKKNVFFFSYLYFYEIK